MVKIIEKPIAPKVGDFINVRFGVGTQVARVEAFTRTGKPKVRAFNASRDYWMPTLRTLNPGDIIGEVTWSTLTYTHRGIGYDQKPLPDLV
jgi:hypothetical protein